MPLTPSFGDRRAGVVVALYRRAERKLLEGLAKAVAPGVGHLLVWMRRLLLRFSLYRSQVDRLIADLDREMEPAVVAALMGAWRDGVSAAAADLDDFDDAAVPDEHDLRRLIDDTLSAVRETHRHVPGVMGNVYRRIIDDAVQAERSGANIDRAQAVQRALEAFARRGITGFVDVRGRRYDLVSYVEMAVRSAVSRAEIDGYFARLAAAGHDLFVVSDVAGSCPLCRPFEGRTISITGSTAGAITRDNSSGRTVTVTVMCSLAEARERGLFHRACRHTLRVWTPDDPTPPRATRVPGEIRARRRRQRDLARRVRERQRMGFIAQS
ncbi:MULTISPECIES: phage minor capsid protein [Nocardia]|uniref:phage minor capsid protein n=1 Tax=Nocardia TaxID=1817 RepID=UPI000D69ECB7|nr:MULTISPECIES: phage minor capsid protein [Nocardia]